MVARLDSRHHWRMMADASDDVCVCVCVPGFDEDIAECVQFDAIPFINGPNDLLWETLAHRSRRRWID